MRAPKSLGAYATIALLAIARKFIILDLGETEPAKIAALAAAALALGAVHWLVRDQDRREQHHAGTAVDFHPELSRLGA